MEIHEKCYIRRKDVSIRMEMSSNKTVNVELSCETGCHEHVHLHWRLHGHHGITRYVFNICRSISCFRPEQRNGNGDGDHGPLTQTLVGYEA